MLNDFPPTMETFIQEQKNKCYLNKVINNSFKKNKISDFLDFLIEKIL